ncbi:hypothetical protein [Cellulomonas sp. Y8]|uniref:hypothetical protein n=1 Tax=Cellulomonas sp. Y8 TaxID=2591145 RepID=UPI001AEFC859|nr:hypothetical protein [Cellulomonas sp. Y8]
MQVLTQPVPEGRRVARLDRRDQRLVPFDEARRALPPRRRDSATIRRCRSRSVTEKPVSRSFPPAATTARWNAASSSA